MRLSAVVAIAENGVIGREGGLPWHLSSDLKRFKRLTVGRVIVMGRNTHESIGRPLPDRLNVVVTSQPYLSGCVVAPSLDAALALPEVAGAPEVVIVGGARLYREALPRCDSVHLTIVHARPEGDAFFHFEREGFREVEREELPADEKNEHPTTYVHLVREHGNGR